MEQRIGTAVLMLAITACGREQYDTTIRAADAPPGPPAPITQTIGEQPMITTSGSPPPFEQPRAEFEEITITDDAINARPSIPVKNTVFRIVNAGQMPAEVEMRSDGAILPGTQTTIAPGASVVVQVMVTEKAYEIVASGERPRRATITTYRPR